MPDRAMQAFIVLDDGTTYGVPEKARLLIVNQDGLNQVDEFHDVTFVNPTNVLGEYDLAELLEDTLNKHGV